MRNSTTPSAAPPSEMARDAETMCQALLRMDTTNPPGNERQAADYLDGKLREVGYETVLKLTPYLTLEGPTTASGSAR